MSLNILKDNTNIVGHEKLKQNFEHFQTIIAEANKHQIPSNTKEKINTIIKDFNNSTATDKKLLAEMRAAERKVIDTLAKEAKLVPQNYHAALWLILGMVSFGFPFGALLALLNNNLGLIGLGLPIGMIIGAFIGKRLDNKAAIEGRQLNVKLA